MGNRLVEMLKAQCPNRLLLADGAPNGAFHIGDAQFALGLCLFSFFLSHYALPRSTQNGWTSELSLPRIRARSSLFFSSLRAFRVARATLSMLLLPWLLLRMSRTPAASSTARTLPPAITPVPGEAGRSITTAPPCLAVTSCGMVVPASETRVIFLRAPSAPLRIDSGTPR